MGSRIDAYFLHLTGIGQEVAEKIYERHPFFTDSLIEIGVDPVQTGKDACRIEHVISNENFQKLKEAYKEEDDGSLSKAGHLAYPYLLESDETAN